MGWLGRRARARGGGGGLTTHHSDPSLSHRGRAPVFGARGGWPRRRPVSRVTTMAMAGACRYERGLQSVLFNLIGTFSASVSYPHVTHEYK
jgi:hypothetical protein